MGEWVGGGGLHKASGCYPQPAGMPGPAAEPHWTLVGQGEEGGNGQLQ